MIAAGTAGIDGIGREIDGVGLCDKTVIRSSSFCGGYPFVLQKSEQSGNNGIRKTPFMMAFMH